MQGALILLFSGMLALAGCNKTTKALTSPIPVASGSGNGNTFVNNDFFVNTLPPNAVTMYIHPADAPWTQPCKISNGTTRQDLRCVVEAQEEDIYHQGITLTYQFPSDMCQYGWRKDFSYYNLLPGQGPTTITIRSGVNNTLADNTQDGSVTSFTSAGGTATVQAPTTPTGSLNCSTDYSWQMTPAGPNCCWGNYTLIVNTYTHTSTTDPVSGNVTWSQSLLTTTTQNTWPGADANCLAGPAMDLPDAIKNSKGYPTQLEFFAGDATINRQIDIPSPLSKNTGANLYLANYFTPLTSNSVPTNTAVEAARPDPMKNHGSFTPSYSYEYTCVNASAEIINRIRVYIRSWSKNSDFTLLSNSATSNQSTSDSFYPDPYCDRTTWFGNGVCSLCSTIGVACNSNTIPSPAASDVYPYFF